MCYYFLHFRRPNRPLVLASDWIKTKASQNRNTKKQVSPDRAVFMIQTSSTSHHCDPHRHIRARGTDRNPTEQGPFSSEPHICRPETIGERDSRSASYHVMPRRLDGVNCTPLAFICA